MTLPQQQKKYVYINASTNDGELNKDVVQSVMFITDTYTEEKQAEKNIYYITKVTSDLPRDAIVIPLYQ